MGRIVGDNLKGALSVVATVLQQCLGAKQKQGDAKHGATPQGYQIPKQVYPGAQRHPLQRGFRVWCYGRSDGRRNGGGGVHIGTVDRSLEII